MYASQAILTVNAVEASDSWGFVGVVSVGSREAYRTMRAYATPGDAIDAVERLLGQFIGTLLAGHEWREAVAEFGHAPLRSELGLVSGPRHPTSRPAHPDADHAGA